LSIKAPILAAESREPMMSQNINLCEGIQVERKPVANPLAPGIKPGSRTSQLDAGIDTNPYANNAIDAVNKKTMNAAAHSCYAFARGLKDAEVEALKEVADEVRDQPILDLGFGGGRTVEPLMELSKDYTGLDYAEKMVDVCRSIFPGVDFRHGDARDLSQFDDNSFAMVVFSCEGICMVDHEGRMAILAEVLRVLKPGGIFIFSTMNQESDYHTRGLQLPDFQVSFNPARLVVRGARFTHAIVNRLVNRMKNKQREIRAEAFSIINDVYHDYSTMIYYISLANQRKQLDSVGFQSQSMAFDLKGHVIEKDSTDNTLTLIARKRLVV
jgi:ubiquinone/menaquinone biosynthesis C-methylase UbiE